MAFNGKSGDGPHSKRICIGINSENMEMVSIKVLETWANINENIMKIS
jgi:hypothetical protein